MFDFSTALSRNIGWLTTDELAILRTKRIAIAGLGGVGGSHLLALTRLGVGHFQLADFDVVELVNFNRQAGATMSRLGQPKVDVLAEMALDINPELGILRFPEGIGEANMDTFLAGVDLYVDGLDFFVMDARQQVFAACAAKGIPAITAAPLGWGVSLLVFMPGEMTFADYFQLDGKPETAQFRRFLVGLSPEALQLSALVDPTRLDIAHRTGPSTVVGCELCAALAATNAVKILLGRGPIEVAPNSLHFDAYSGKLSIVSRPGGMSHPLMQQALGEEAWAESQRLDRSL